MKTTAFNTKLLNDCLEISHDSYLWQGPFFFHTPFRYTQDWEGVNVPAKGSLDLATRAGTVTSSGPALRIDNYNRHSGAIRIGSLAFKATGSGAVVTGRIDRTRTIFSRLGATKPLLRIKRWGFDAGPFLRKGKPVMDTFVVGISGNATVMPALTRELNRIRCRGPHIVTSHPIPAGTFFGLVKFQLRTDAATGLGGTFEMGGLEATASDPDTGDDVAVTITPAAPARLAGKAVHWDLPADQRVPLTCKASYECGLAVGVQFPLPGSIVFSAAGRSATLANLALDTHDLNGLVEPVITGTLDGAPVTVARGSDTSSDFDPALGAALNLPGIRTSMTGVVTHFAKTAAPS